MKQQLIECTGEGHTCDYMRQHSDDWGKTGKSVCGKPAMYTDGKKYYCQRHSGKGRFVIRDGDVGEIKARFDTEAELRAAFPSYPGMRMQHLSPSHRRDII